MDSFQAIDHSDSRYSMKQRDIAATISKMQDATRKQKSEWESKLGDELVAATEDAVLRGGGDRSLLHGSAKFRSNFEQWLRSLK